MVSPIYPTPITPSSGGGDDLYTVLRLPLVIGAFLGLIPIRGLGSKAFDKEKTKFTWRHIRTLISILVTSSIALHTFFMAHSFFIGMISKQNSAGKLVMTFGGVWFYTVGTLVYTFFLTRSARLTAYFESWVTVSEEIRSTMEPDPKLSRDIKLICTFVLLDSFGENTLFHFHAMDPEKRGRMGTLTLDEVLRDYYNSNQYIFPFFDYSPWVAIGLLVTNKLATYAWNFGDIFLIVMARGLCSRYNSLNRYLESLMVEERKGGSVALIKRGTVCWPDVRRHFLLITKLLEEGNRLLSPLLWISCVTDIFFVCRQLYEGLSPSNDSSSSQAINKIYVAWSTFHLVIRTLGVNWSCALINEHAHRIRKILQHCHPQEYDDNVRRLERFVGSKIIGINGNGCFVITRSFILMVMSAIFTLEVVLLQNAGITVG